MVSSPPPPVKTAVQVVFTGPYPEESWEWDDAPIIRLDPLYAGGVEGSAGGPIEIKVRVPDLSWYFHPGIWYPQLFTRNNSLASSLATISLAER